VYSYEILPEARDQVDGLSSAAQIYYAELITFVELTPWVGHRYFAPHVTPVQFVQPGY
jgi:hypothetical protein